MPPLTNTHFPTSSLSYHPYASPVPVLLPQSPAGPSPLITPRIFGRPKPASSKPKRQRKKPLPPSSLSRQTPIEALRATNPETALKPPWTGDLQSFSISALSPSSPNRQSPQSHGAETSLAPTHSDTPLSTDITGLTSLPTLSIDTSLSVFKTSPQTPKDHPHSAPASSQIPSSNESTPLTSSLASLPLPPSSSGGEASSSKTTIEELEQLDWARHLAVVRPRLPISTEVLTPREGASQSPTPEPSGAQSSSVSTPAPVSGQVDKTDKEGKTPTGKQKPPKLDLEQFWVSHWPPRNEREGMFDNIAAMFGGGIGVGTASMVSMGVQAELQQLKSAPVLNLHFGMVIKYLDCLNRLMDGMVMSMGPSGVTPWLVEVQTLIRLLQKRIFQRMPLTLPERTALMNFAAYWRQMIQPPYAMGRPEAQLVLITLTELASR